jgi:hypothetical protein
MAVVFMSYSHKDESLRDQLEAHLALLKNQGLIEAWHDRRILAGAQVDDAIFDKLEVADVILLLVSSDFLSSQYCYSREMMRAMQRHEAGEAKVVPVILRHCDWHGAPFGQLMAAPRDGKPITAWADRDEAFADVALQVRRIVEEAGGQAGQRARRGLSTSRDVRQQPNAVAQHIPQVRSSNLRLKKEFSEKDMAEHLRDTFEFVCRYFEGSVLAVSDRNPDVDARYERIDTRRMAAVLYRNGRTISECSVRLEGMGSRDSKIAFSHDASASSGSFNEMLNVEAGDYDLHIKTMGIASMSRGGNRDQKFSQEGAAEYLWELFIQRAQS